MSEAFLRCRGLVKRFGAVSAVDGVDLDLARGDLLALLGPSGCGKTTLLRLIAGFELPDAGTVELGERVLCGPGAWLPPERRRVAMVFQDFALFPHMTVGENVAFGLRGRAPERRVAGLLELVGLEGLQDRMPHQLSGGQQQRVAIARALGADPELILLDEPFSNLDPSIRARVRGEVRQLLRSVGITAVFVTHDQEEALSLAEHVGIMVSGRILQVGTPAEVYTRSASPAVGAFLGNANLLPGRMEDGSVECELGRFPVAADHTGRSQVMIRSESLALAADGGVGSRVESVEYFGHDQMVSVRTDAGTLLRIRTLAPEPMRVGERVGVVVTGEVFAFPVPA
ncbi:MAG: ABC transporter ATP-binding protein [Candidatus Limnocylindria bacterium]